MSFTWDDRKEARLRAMWEEGISATEIGFALGCSKSAVLGKKMRLGLEMRRDGWAVVNQRAKAEGRRVGRPPGRSQKQQHADHSQRERLRAAATRKTKPPIRVIAREGRLVEPLNLPFAELDDHQKPTMCRFITLEREGKHLFCARPTEHDTSYCDDCARVVFTADGYERVIQNEVKPLRQPANGRVAKPFRMPYELAGVALDVREVPFQ
jgi:hypothetical protein